MSPSGISVVTSTGGPRELADTARLCEEAGLASVWATEFYDRSATIALAAMAQATSTIELGSAIAYGFGRTPLVLAAEARDLDELSGGRMTLGLGTGTPRMQRDWHGIDGEHSASRMEELVPLVRRLWRLHEGPVEHDGRFYRVNVQPTAPPREPYRRGGPDLHGRRQRSAWSRPRARSATGWSAILSSRRSTSARSCGRRSRKRRRADRP